MPIYDYRCTACGKTFELLVRAATVPTCPACGSEALDRLVSAPAAPGQSADLIARARRQAAREGHFSHYARLDKPPIK